MEGQRGDQPEFLIDGKQFDASCVDQRMRLGAVEEWTVTNDSEIPHPCHIHVNPFQIVEVDGEALPKPWIWWDTVALPPGSSTQHSTIKIRHRFLNFEGKYVMHCHILGHEDRGMMQVLEVGETSGLPLCTT